MEVKAILRQSGWLPLAFAGCAFSLVAISPWWKAILPDARFGAFFDLIVTLLLVCPPGAWVAKRLKLRRDIIH